MEKELNDSVVYDPSCSRESETDKSFVGKIKSQVSDIINNTPLSKWFRKQNDSGSVIRRHSEDEEIYEMQPPPKRVKLPNDNTNDYNNSISFSEILSPKNRVNSVPKKFNCFPEPVAGPSGSKSHKLLSSNATSINNVKNAFKTSELLNGRKDSDSEESTSGYSSVVRIGSKEQVCESQGSSKQTSPLENSPSKSRSLFQAPCTGTTSRSLFAERSLSPNMNSSLSSRRPSFNASTFGTPNFVDKTLATKRIINSPFYSGRITYGGASAYGRKVGRPSHDPQTSLRKSVQIKPVNKSAENGNLQLGKTARRILDTLEQYSSPVNDAKKIPISSKRPRQGGLLTKYTGARPYLVRESKVASNTELQVPSVSDLLRMKQNQQKSRLQNSTEAVRQIATCSKSALNSESYKIPLAENEKEKHTGKIKTKIASVRQKSQPDETVSELKLNPVALPITNLPKFEFKFAPAPAEKTQKTDSLDAKSAPVVAENATKIVETEKSVRKAAAEFKFSEPVILGENLKSIVAINDFKFSEPLCRKRKNSDVTDSDFKVPENNLNFKMPENRAPVLIPNKKSKSNGETGAESVAVLKTGSVMDILGKKSEEQATLMEKFKPAEGTWECPTCMIRNQADKAKCVACETSNPKKTNKVAEPSKPLPGFGDKFKPPSSTWECDACMIRNKNELARCAACETPKPAAKTTPAPGAKAPPTLPSVTAASTSTWGNKFVPPASTWECGTCMIRNKEDANKCIACETPKPGAVAKPTLTAGVGGSTFGSDFKIKDNEWECGVCMVRNKSSSTKCQCCETAKPGTVAKTGDSLQTDKKPVLSFTFGIDKATASSFSFGLPPEANKPSAATAVGLPSIFGEGARKVESATAPVSFKFGVPASAETGTKKVEEKPKDGPVKLAPVVPKLPASNPLLKPSEKLPEKAAVASPGFGFGVSSTGTITSFTTSTASTNQTMKTIGTASPVPPASTVAAEPIKPTFNFNGSLAKPNASAEKITFGAKPEVTASSTASTFNAPAPAPSNLFSFGAKPAAAAAPPLAPIAPADAPKQIFKFRPSGGEAPKFGIGASEPKNSAPVNNGFGSPSPAPTFNSKPAPAPSFGAPVNRPPEYKPFSFGSSAPSEPANKAPMFSFNQTPAVAPSQNKGFGFGSTNASSTTPAATFNFGGTKTDTPNFGAQAPAPIAGNLFMNAPPAAAQNGIFNFGSAASSAVTQKAGFSFGAAVNSTPAPMAAPQTGGFNFSGAPPSFDATAKPSFNFTAGSNVASFSAPPPTDGGMTGQRKIKRAVRRTQR